MTYVVIKKIKNREYLYLVESKIINNKTIQKTLKYIGPKRDLTEDEVNCIKESQERKDWILLNFEEQLSYQKHNELQKISDMQTKYLKKLDIATLEKEKEKFLSDFISNSNSIEGSTMTQNETSNYLFNNIVPTNTTKKEIHMAENLFEAWKYVQKNKDRFPNEKDLCELHKLVNKNIESEETLGKFKKYQNYIDEIHTSAPVYVKERLKELLNWIKKAYKEINDFEVAFQSHIQFEIIHPFVDGNGRVGRLLLNWLLMYKNKEPFSIKNKNRGQYISALNNSRRGKIEAICIFCYEEYLNQYKFYSFEN